jgi:hypothetical protein
MIKVSLDNLKPGMILAQPVRNHQGLLLLDTGAKVSKKNIRVFKSWGIFQVSIKGNVTKAGSPAGEPEIRIKTSIEKDLREKFSGVLDDPVMVEIYNAAGKLLMKDVRNSESENEHS